ncbi:PAS domain-containing sensor histidine kinase [Ekhidna sp.]
MKGISRKKLHEVIADSTTDFLSIASSDYTYLAVNETYARRFGRKANEIEGLKIKRLLGEDHFQKLVKPNFDKCLKSNEIVRYEDWFDLDQGRRFFSVSYSPIEIEGERAVVVNAHDNTRHKLMEESLEKAVEELEDANSFKNKLFSVVSHDLRSPINAVNNFLELLADDETNFEQIKSLIPMMTVRLNSTKSMLDNLLGWTTTQLKGEEVQYEHFQFSEIVNEVIHLFEDQISHKSLKVILDFPDELSIKGDKNGVRMVIRNLFSNAIKFSFDGGTICIHSEEKIIDGFQKFKFADSGKGMSTEKAGRLFSAIVDSEEGTKGEGGTGLGMMLSADFIESQGGSIEVESKEGEGATFYFTLPLSAS